MKFFILLIVLSINTAYARSGDMPTVFEIDQQLEQSQDYQRVPTSENSHHEVDTHEVQGAEQIDKTK